MASKLHIKLFIGLVAVFGLLLTSFALYPRMRLVYMKSQLYSGDAKISDNARSRLLGEGRNGEEIVRLFYENNDTGYGKPRDGLVARLLPGASELGNRSTVHIGLQIRNITNRDCWVYWASEGYPLSTGEACVDRIGAYVHLPETEGTFFPKLIRPDSVHIVSRWAEIVRGAYDIIVVQVNESEGFGFVGCAEHQAADRFSIFARLWTGKLGKGPKLVTPTVTFRLVPPVRIPKR